GILLLLLLPSSLLHLREFLQLFRLKDGFDLGRGSLTNLIDFLYLLVGSERWVIANRIHLLSFVSDDGTQFGLLIIRKIQGILRVWVRGGAILIGICCGARLPLWRSWLGRIACWGLGRRGDAQSHCQNQRH